MSSAPTASPRPLELPEPNRIAALEFVTEHLADLSPDAPVGAGAIVGGQRAADAALAAFDVRGYAARRNEVYPEQRRGASRLSPFIRHGLLPLRRVWDHVAPGPRRDVEKFRDELLWQEYARHWYVVHGERTRLGLRRELPADDAADGGWDTSMRCVAEPLAELHDDGWMVNQTRMWLASDWTVRRGRSWREGEDRFFRHLLDGSRAANRLGWQWTTGVGSSKPYGFSRMQVTKRAPGLCERCDHRNNCPIEDWPDEPSYGRTPDHRADSPARFGPIVVERHSAPDVVWLTAESLGDADLALTANPELPAVFVFDEPLLAALGLSTKRLVFLAESLADLTARRPVKAWRGRPVDVLAGRHVAVTHAPVPGFVARARAIRPVELHPWLWLCAPRAGGSVSSFSAWRRKVAMP